jgi:hypothetical protein
VNGLRPLFADGHANLLNPKSAPDVLFAKVVDEEANQEQAHHQEAKKHHETSVRRGASSRCRFPRQSGGKSNATQEAVNLLVINTL